MPTRLPLSFEYDVRVYNAPSGGHTHKFDLSGAVKANFSSQPSYEASGQRAIDNAISNGVLTVTYSFDNVVYDVSEYVLNTPWFGSDAFFRIIYSNTFYYKEE